MSNCPLCNLDPAAPTPCNGNRATGLLRLAWRSIQWLFPATLLVLMPKCPLCVAAYVAFFTGIGISVATARCLQIMMEVCCLASLAYLAVRYTNQFFQRSNNVHRTRHAW